MEHVNLDVSIPIIKIIISTLTLWGFLLFFCFVLFLVVPGFKLRALCLQTLYHLSYRPFSPPPTPGYFGDGVLFAKADLEPDPLNLSLQVASVTGMSHQCWACCGYF
jgi:hypothetical protein